MFIKIELRQLKQMLYIFKTAGNEIVHANDLKSLINKPVHKDVIRENRLLP